MHDEPRPAGAQDARLCDPDCPAARYGPAGPARAGAAVRFHDLRHETGGVREREVHGAYPGGARGDCPGMRREDPVSPLGCAGHGGLVRALGPVAVRHVAVLPRDRHGAD